MELEEVFCADFDNVDNGCWIVLVYAKQNAQVKYDETKRVVRKQAEI